MDYVSLSPIPCVLHFLHNNNKKERKRTKTNNVMICRHITGFQIRRENE